MQSFITQTLERMHESLKQERSGNVANYIPELARADPESFGIALVTVDGHVHQVGDSLQPFSIQSISKAFTYGVALADSGVDVLKAKVDVEPSGEAFNSISLEPGTGRPRNPMINAGAIVATSLVEGNDSESMIGRIRSRFSEFAARELRVDETIYRSELDTGFRNRAIANLLRNYEILEGDPEEPLDAYFRQCSIMVTAQDLAVMAATLANRGVNPITSVTVLEESYVPDVLSVMASCGMYDYSGNWSKTVGMPAKSGVGGGIVAVLPGQFGLAVYSPPLDAKGNSVRGIKVCEALSEQYELHMLNSARHTTMNTVRAIYTMKEVSSRFERDRGEALLLQEQGDRILVCELTGEQSFIATEELCSTLLNKMQSRNILVLDFERMTGCDHATSTLFAQLFIALAKDEIKVIICGLQTNYDFHRRLAVGGAFSKGQKVVEVPHIDDALEVGEDFLLAEQVGNYSTQQCVPLERQPLFEGLHTEQIDWISQLIERQVFQPGEVICHHGDRADCVYLVEKGRVDIEMKPAVSLEVTRQNSRKVASFCGGAVIGEAAFFEQGIRSANVVAVDEVSMFRLDPECFEPGFQAPGKDKALSQEILSRIYRNLARLEFERLSTANRVLMTLTN